MVRDVPHDPTPARSAGNQEHGGAAGLARLAARAGHDDVEAAPSAPVMNHLRPLRASRRRRVPLGRAARSGPPRRPVRARSSRRPNGLAPDQRAQVPLTLVRVATWSSRCTLPSSGALMFIAIGPNRERPAASKTGARSTMPRPRPPRSTDRGEPARRVACRAAADAQRLAAGCLDVTVVLVVDRQHVLLDEGSGPRRDRLWLVHRGALPSVVGRSVRGPWPDVAFRSRSKKYRRNGCHARGEGPHSGQPSERSGGTDDATQEEDRQCRRRHPTHPPPPARPPPRSRRGSTT